MATQTVTVTRAPVNGASRSSAAPAGSGAIDYSLTDLDLLETPDGEITAATEADAATAARGATGKDRATEEQGTGGERQEGAVEPQADSAPTGDASRPPAEFEPAFALPGIGPKLREICERDAEYREVFPKVADARALREIFSTPEAARAASAAQAQLAHLDRLVESRDPRAHAELLAGLQRLAPQAFRDLAITFAEQLAGLDPEAYRQVAAAMAAQAGADRPSATGWPEHVALLSRAVEQQDWPAVKFLAAALSSSSAGASRPEASGRTVPLQLPSGLSSNWNGRTEGRRDAGATLPPGATAAANQFLETVNGGVEQAVHASVASKVAELLPEAPEGARQKIAGEIFRELDQALRQDPELLEQVRESVGAALRSGAALSGREPAERVARLISSRARAALPGVAKRVVADWTETVLRSSRERRSRQSESASRVEVGRGGAPAPVPLKPRGVDYMRMTDEEILNMD